MTHVIAKPRYAARMARGVADVQAAQALRHLAFLPPAARAGALDCDAFDENCLHVLIEVEDSGQLVGCFRMMHLQDGKDIARSYSAQYYDLAPLHGFAHPMVEMGRFCVHPARQDPDILRVAWGMMTRYVDAHGIGMLFGCSSFKGAQAAPYADAFALLRARHLAPERWRPGIGRAEVYPYAAHLAHLAPDLKRAQLTMPPLLRSYLLMGGWVSDHAVVDRQMNTLHVFTGLEIAAIPEARKRLLRATAEGIDAVTAAE